MQRNMQENKGDKSKMNMKSDDANGHHNHNVTTKMEYVRNHGNNEIPGVNNN